jgi:hypothetical protein
VKLYLPLASVVTVFDVMPASTTLAPEMGTPWVEVIRPLITSVPVSAWELTESPVSERSPQPAAAAIVSATAPRFTNGMCISLVRIGSHDSLLVKGW